MVNVAYILGFGSRAFVVTGPGENAGLKFDDFML